MIGEAFALFSALCFGVSGAAIARGAPEARGDNGAFLSILLTLLLSGLLWIWLGDVTPWPLTDLDILFGLGLFVAAGVFATVLGRLAMFNSIALAGVITASLFRRLIPVFAGALAFFLLGERVTLDELFGMVIILASIFLAVSERRLPVRSSSTDSISFDPSQKKRGQIYGTASALCYGCAYVTRKLAMQHTPDAALGAVVGAITGIIWYSVAAALSPRYSATVVGVFRTTGVWQFVAALSMAMGQTSQFFALANTDVATVAIIGSTEVFISAYLAAFVFKTERRPSTRVVIATVIATAGIILVARG